MSGYILVKRDRYGCDEAVLTAGGSLSLSEREIWPGHPWVQFEPITSPHIEHAFVFPGSWQAYRWLDRLLAPKETTLLTWVVRVDPEFFPGEIKNLYVNRPLGEPELTIEGRAAPKYQQRTRPAYPPGDDPRQEGE